MKSWFSNFVRNSALWFLVITIVLVVVWWLYILLLPFFYPILEERAAFGETFGGIESLFSAIGLTGVIVALLLQTREQAEQRKDAEETKTRQDAQELLLNKTANIQEQTKNVLERLVDAQNKTAKTQQELARLTYLSILPSFELHLSYNQNQQLKLQIFNISDFTAIDVEVFIAISGGTKAEPKDVQILDARYSQFPGRRGVKRYLSLNPNRERTAIYLLLQYKSAIGSNHHRIYSFDPIPMENNDLRLVEARPASMEEVKRVRFSKEASDRDKIWLDDNVDLYNHLEALKIILSAVPGAVLPEEVIRKARGIGDWSEFQFSR